MMVNVVTIRFLAANASRGTRTAVITSIAAQRNRRFTTWTHMASSLCARSPPVEKNLDVFIKSEPPRQSGKHGNVRSRVGKSKINSGVELNVWSKTSRQSAVKRRDVRTVAGR